MQRWTGNLGGWRATTRGFVLHATRGGLSSQAAEYQSCVNWFLNPASQASSTIVIGPDGEITEMVPLERVCWTTGEHNAEYAAVEMAQGRLGEPITEKARASLAWWLHNVFFKKYPNLKPSPTTLPFHSELPQGIRVGKTDLFAKGDDRGIAWRAGLISLTKQMEV